MVFHIVAVGRVKDPGLRAACDEYLDRISRYGKITLREVADARRSRAPDTMRAEEGEALLRAIPDGARAVALTRTGTSEDSRAFAKRIGRWREDAKDVAFVIGGAHGLDERVLERTGERMSLSPMTLTHELARLVFLEQLYRGNTILRGEPYHKGD